MLPQRGGGSRFHAAREQRLEGREVLFGGVLQPRHGQPREVALLRVQRDGGVLEVLGFVVIWPMLAEGEGVGREAVHRGLVRHRSAT